MHGIKYMKPVLALALAAGLLAATAEALIAGFRREAAQADLLDRGRRIAEFIFYPGEPMIFETNWFPAMLLFQAVPSDRFKSSTEYLRRACSSEYLGIMIDDLTPLSAAQNEWNVVADHSNRPAQEPFLISRNLNLTNLNSTNLELRNEGPLGRRGIVVVTCGAMATFIPSNQIASYLSGLHATNMVLRP